MERTAPATKGTIPMPDTSNPARRPGRTGKTQRKLFTATMEIMEHRGSAHVSIEEVAQRAGVSKGTVYYNFGSKKTMIDRLLQYGTHLLVESMSEASIAQSDPREGLRKSISTALTYLHEHRGFTRLWVSEVWKGLDAWTDSMVDNRQEILDFIESRVRALRSRYTIDTAQDTRALALSIFGATFMLAMDREIHGVQRSIEDSTRAVMLVFDGYIRH